MCRERSPPFHAPKRCNCLTACRCGKVRLESSPARKGTLRPHLPSVSNGVQLLSLFEFRKKFRSKFESGSGGFGIIVRFSVLGTLNREHSKSRESWLATSLVAALFRA